VEELIDDGMCFACGPRNEIGLGLRFKPQGDEMVAVFLPRDCHQGYQGIVHGGILSVLLDEAMAHVLMQHGKMALTAKMEIHYRRIARVGERLQIRGRLLRERSRMLELEAEVWTEDEERIASATGKWMKVEPPHAGR
jgi:uncharacterized protein (TIGR00369 family)